MPSSPGQSCLLGVHTPLRMARHAAFGGGLTQWSQHAGNGQLGFTCHALHACIFLDSSWGQVPVNDFKSSLTCH